MFLHFSQGNLLKLLSIPYGHSLPTPELSMIINQNSNMNISYRTLPTLPADDIISISTIVSSTSATIKSDCEFSTDTIQSDHHPMTAKQKKKSISRFHKFEHQQETRLKESLAQIDGNGGILSTWITKRHI